MESTLGKRITANRKRLGFTQDQLAEQLGITAQAVSKWENDLSCPDISILPKLADIFGVTTDALLGREEPVTTCKTEVITEAEENSSGFTYDSDTGKMDFHWEGAKLDRIGLAVWVILTGILYLTVHLLRWQVSFWNILWPGFLFVFGIFGLYPKFSVFRFGCALVGGFFLLEKLHVITAALNSGIIIAAVILLFGISLLLDTLRKRSRSRFQDKFCNARHGKMIRDYSVDDDHFIYNASFGSDKQAVQLDILRCGEISVNFGDYAVDMTGVASLDEKCTVCANCSFGELTIFVPRHFTVIPDSSTSFASLDVQGHPAAPSEGTIHLNADVSFGEIRIQYI